MPEGWWHQTRTVTARSLSISRNLVTPSNAAPLAAALATYCAAATSGFVERYATMCAALAPCLVRLAAVRDGGGDADGKRTAGVSHLGGWGLGC